MELSLRTLLIDDNPDDRLLALRELRRDFPDLSVEQVLDEKDFERALRNNHPPLVITNYQLHWTNGLMILRRVKARWPDGVVIMFTNEGNEEIAVQAMKAGLDDYVIKTNRHSIRLPIAVHLALTRRRQRQEIRIAETRYRRLVEGLPIGLFQVTADGQICDLNPALIEILGYPDRETALAHTLMVIGQNHQQSFWQELAAADRLRGSEVQVQRYSGELIWVRMTGRAVRNTEDQIEYYEGSIEDITTRKQADDALRISEQKFRQLVEYSVDGIVLYDEAGHIIEWSRGQEQNTGLQRSEVLGRPGWQVQFEMSTPQERTPTYMDHLRRMCQKLSQTGETRWLYQLIERSIHRPDGAQRVLQTITFPIPTSSGYMAGTISRDITEQKQAEVELKARAKQQAVVTQLGHQALLADNDPNRLLEQAVKLVAQTLPVSHAEVLELMAEHQVLRMQAGIGWPADMPGHVSIEASTDSLPGYTLQIGTAVISDDLRQETRFSYHPLLRAEGIISSACVIIHSHHEPYGTLGIHTTEPRSFSADDIHFVEAIANVLADAIERRRIEQARLDLERKMLETQKLESLGVMAGGIAHDFNNLLAVILGNASLALIEMNPHESAYASVESIEIAARRAAELTQQLLAYAGRAPSAVQALDLNSLISELTALLHVSLPKTVTLHYHPLDGLPQIKADGAQIRQVILNLVMNAAEAIGERDGNVTLTTGVRYVDRTYLARTYLAPDLPEGIYVELNVADTGFGMDADTQARIFEPFFTTKLTGRGLGLAAVLGIVRGHHGALRVDSTVDRGTVFTILLPSTIEAAERTPVDQQRMDAWKGTGMVLIIEDEAEVAHVAVRMLERLGMSTMVARDGQAGLELFHAYIDDIDGILLDLTMPRLSGEKTFRTLRQHRADIPIIIMSGYSGEELTGRFEISGLTTFLQKPFTASQLTAAVQQVFLLKEMRKTL